MSSFSVAEDLPPRVRPGFHDVMLQEFRTAMMFQGKAPKLVLTFSIVSFGEDHGKRISRYYNVKRIIGKPSKGGRFQVPATGDFAREYFTLFEYNGNRLDRLPMTLFNGKVIRAEAETVTRARGQPIPEPLQYSKLTRLMKVTEE